jgi:predicted O-methyltransferase YrrM
MGTNRYWENGGRMHPSAARSWVIMGIVVFFCAAMVSAAAQNSVGSAALDASVEKFLNSRRSSWQDWNVPYQDGKVLHDLIVRKKYTRALEIGTSSGHSAIWIAWALSKTGGKLITIEIDANLHKKAMQNFKAAGLEGYIDARLADAHDLIRELEGPFDFVFLDADKEWYTQYFKDLDPKLAKGGCFTAHNASNAYAGIKEFLDYVRSRPGYQTSIDRSSNSGISISYKN